MNRLSDEEVRRYIRQIILPGIGPAGQEKLRDAAVLIVGVGGLGSPVSLYLAAAGIGRIGLVDHDSVSLSNLQRQVIHSTEEIGRPKVESAAKRLSALNPKIEIETYAEPFTSSSAERIGRGYDLIVDGTDNFPARYLINDLSLKLQIPFVYGAIFRMEGQVSVFPGEGGPCYRCLFPEPPPPERVLTCEEAGVLGVVPGTIGTIQATEAIKMILGIGTPLAGRLLVYDALTMRFETIAISQDPDCPACTVPPEKIELTDYHGFCGVPTEGPGLPEEARISPLELKGLIDAGERIRLIDVRQPSEWEISHIEGTELVPHDRLAEWMKDSDRGERIVAICKSGERSALVVSLLREAGFERAMNLEGGIDRWRDEVDPSLPDY